MNNNHIMLHEPRKFRVWIQEDPEDIYNGSMEYDIDNNGSALVLSGDGCVYSFGGSDLFVELTHEPYTVPMFYLDVKDVTGHEVYEGDIVLWGDNGYSAIKYIVSSHKGCAFLEPYNCDIEDDDVILLYYVDEKDLRIIGHVFSDPRIVAARHRRLLEERKK